MSVMTEVRRLFLAAIRTTGVSEVVFPSLAAPLTVTAGKSYAYGAWGQLAADVGADSWIVGVYLRNPAVAAEYQVQIGSGAAASETGFAVARVARQDITAAGAVFGLHVPLFSRRLIPNGTRLAARGATSDATADRNIDVSVSALQGL